MKKLTTILFLSIFFSTTSIAKEVVETWECTEYGKANTKVLVKAKIFKSRVSGEIDVVGITHQTAYGVEGFKRRWDFDQRDDGRYKYSLVIKPDGDGLYYEFPEVTTPVSPNMILDCKGG